MQLLHMLGGGDGPPRRAERRSPPTSRPAGSSRAAILAEPLPPSGPTESIPDVREVGGWIHSSLPLEVRVEREVLEIVRLRQLVAPDGELERGDRT